MNFKKCGFAALGCFLLATGLVAALVPNGLPSILSIIADENDYNLTINKNSGVEAPAEFGEVTYDYNQHASFTFSSIKSTNDGVGVLQAHSTIVKNQASKGLRGVNATFSGGDLFAYSRFEEAEETEFKYTLTSGVEIFVTGNYVRFEVGDTDVTLTSLSIYFNCNNADEKPTNPIGLLSASHNTLRIEAEDSEITNPKKQGPVSGDAEVKVGKEDSCAIEPSGGSYAYNLSNIKVVNKNKSNKDTTYDLSNFAYFTFMFNSNADGLAVFSFGISLYNDERNLANMFRVQLNGETQTIYDSSIVCPAATETPYWEWTKIPAYALNVKKGINVLKLTLGSKATKFDYIELDSDLSLTKLTTNHVTWDKTEKRPDYVQVDAEKTITENDTVYTASGHEYTGRFGNANYYEFTYTVTAAADTTALMFIVGASGNTTHNKLTVLEYLKVNNSEDGVIHEDDSINWTNGNFNTTTYSQYYENSYGIVPLKSGSNTVTFRLLQATNIAGISFISTTTLS